MSKKEESSGSGEDSTTAVIKSLSLPGGSGVRLQPQAPLDNIVDKPSSQKPKPNVTLGKVQKKVFAPTIPTSRRITKNEASNVDVKEKPKKKEAKMAYTSDKRVPKRRERKGVIKSESVFSMGPAGKMTPGRLGVPSGSSGGSRGAGGSGSHSAGGGGGGARGKVELEAIKEDCSQNMDVPMADPEEEDEVQLLTSRTQFKDSPLPPFQLPLDSGSSHGHPKNLKDEPHSRDAALNVAGAQEASSLTAKVLTTAYHTQDRSYLFMQLPDCLPLSSTEAGAGNTGDVAQNPFCGIHEGRIGKLRIHRSGKVSLVLGAVSLEVSLGTPCGFLQEVVCIRPSPPDCKVTSVGHVSTRLVCTPDFENILQHS